MQDNYAKWLGQPSAKPLSEKMPAEWALKEAQRRAGLPDLALSGLPQWQVEFARMIEKHEQPPVDPDVIAVREIVTAWMSVTSQGEDCKGEDEEDILRGLHDPGADFQAALAAYRKHKEAGK